MPYKSPRACVSIPETDLFSFLLSPNTTNSQVSHDYKLFIDGHNGKSLTFNQIKDTVGQLAYGLKEIVGLKKGDVVAVFAPNQYDHIVLQLSLVAINTIVTPGNPAYTEDEFYHQITNSGASTIITVPQLLPVLLRVCSKAGVDKSRIFLFGNKQVEGCDCFMSLVNPTKTLRCPVPDISSNDTAFICYSSGTTGLSKGVILTHKNIITQLIISSVDDYTTEQDVLIGLLPFFHIFGLISVLLSPLYNMSRVVIMSNFELEVFCRFIEKYKVTKAAIVPPIAVLLAKDPRVRKYDLSSLCTIGCGAAPLSRNHIDELHKVVPSSLIQGYGMTETAGGIIIQEPETAVPGSVGKLLPNCECKIVDKDMNELGDDQEGELLFRGPSITKGYLNNPEANAVTFTTDGWLCSGDVGRFDSKLQQFFIVDRIKELIKYNAYQVAPAELEALLLTQVDIMDCCVVGRYDDIQATELPTAFVVLKENVQPTSTKAKEIYNFVASNVASYKHLRGGIRFTKTIPKTVSGKILRKEVKKWIAEEKKNIREARL
ncbi:hypothetical protein BDF14DRAFT_1769439 [Spinellus fusiger]|nr:hypothetical protein BDF14DRAFT_1769439 [Spinellus fusiger]